MNKVQARIAQITGAPGTIEEALDQWENERKAMKELFDENQAYELINHQIIMAVTLAEKAINQTEEDAGLLIKERTRTTIAKFREYIQKIQNSITLSGVKP